jgi:hypothetical protein
MAKKHEFHPEFSKFPATGFRARELGQTLYFTGKRCLKQHLSPRYASSGNCVECIAKARGKAFINSSGRSSKRSAVNHASALAAIANGALEYLADTACPHGHYRRFVTTNNCIDCDIKSQAKRAEKKRWERVKKLYGLSEFDVTQMLIKQNFQCVICSVEIKTGYHIDHCHSTKKVRGLLCQKCNQAIGLLQESETLFLKASQYIEKHNATTS